MASYLDLNGIKEFLQKLLNPSSIDSSDYVIGVKDGKLGRVTNKVNSTDVTNIVLVDALPDNPDEHTLYLIPEED